MAQVVGMKRFALNHLGGTALALALLVSLATMVTTLSITGDLPDPRGGSGSTASQATADPAVIAAQDRAIARITEAEGSQAFNFQPQRAGDADQLLADQNTALAARTRSAASVTGQIDVLQQQAEQNSVFAATSRYIGNASGQIDVMQVQAVQRFAPTARDRFLVQPEP